MHPVARRPPSETPNVATKPVEVSVRMFRTRVQLPPSPPQKSVADSIRDAFFSTALYSQGKITAAAAEGYLERLKPTTGKQLIVRALAVLQRRRMQSES